LPHQKHRILGLSGEIRTRITKFRSIQETPEAYFPRIESVRDNLGNIWVYGTEVPAIITPTILRPGDIIDIVMTASDPLSEELDYGVAIGRDDLIWHNTNTFSLTMKPNHIGRHVHLAFFIRSPRAYRAMEFYDDLITFVYTILPPLT
jgi:hypothetical protein